MVPQLTNIQNKIITTEYIEISLMMSMNGRFFEAKISVVLFKNFVVKIDKVYSEVCC